MEGVVMFDIDHTLTCPKPYAKCSDYMIKCLTLCNNNNIQIAINTARSKQYYILDSIPATVQSLLYNVNIRYTRNTEYGNVEEDKFRKMQDHSQKYKIPLKKIILIDDRLQTCEYIWENGGECIHVKNKNGITEEEYEELKEFIKKIKT